MLFWTPFTWKTLDVRRFEQLGKSFSSKLQHIHFIVVS